MIRCLMDMSIPEDDKCAKCCIHCEEKDTCENKCCRNSQQTVISQIIFSQDIYQLNKFNRKKDGVYTRPFLFCLSIIILLT